MADIKNSLAAAKVVSRLKLMVKTGIPSFEIVVTIDDWGLHQMMSLVTASSVWRTRGREFSGYHIGVDTARVFMTIYLHK